MFGMSTAIYVPREMLACGNKTINILQYAHVVGSGIDLS